MSLTIQHSALKYPLGVVGLVLASFLSRAVVTRFVDAVVAGSDPWLPTFGSIGRTVALYSLGVQFFALVLVPAGAFWLGAQYGRRSR